MSNRIVFGSIHSSGTTGICVLLMSLAWAVCSCSFLVGDFSITEEQEKNPDTGDEGVDAGVGLSEDSPFKGEDAFSDSPTEQIEADYLQEETQEFWESSDSADSWENADQIMEPTSDDGWTGNEEFSTDEGAAQTIQVYRSVGPHHSDPLARSESYPEQKLVIQEGIASLTAGTGEFPENIGVGDMIQFQTTGSATTNGLVMIVGRIVGDDKQLPIRDPYGNDVPSDKRGETSNWAIYRAYTSLREAVFGVENVGFDWRVSDFDKWNGTAHDLELEGVAWNIACYAGYDLYEDYCVYLVKDKWITSPIHSLRIFSPYKTDEVGKSQRHIGQWTSQDDAYILDCSVISEPTLRITTSFVKLEGVQISKEYVGSGDGIYSMGIAVVNLGDNAQVEINGCIVRGGNNSQACGPSQECSYRGIRYKNSSETSTVTVRNTLIYDFNGAALINQCISLGIDQSPGLQTLGTLISQNNTLVNCDVGIHNSVDQPRVLATNNLFFQCSNACQGDFISGTGYNATDTPFDEKCQNASDPYLIANPFLNFYGDNFHLVVGATPIGKADNLRDYFSDDIDGEPRDNNWDIGADEYHQ